MVIELLMTGMFILIALLISLAVYISKKEKQRRRTYLFLSQIRSSRKAAEAEAARLMRMIERGQPRGGRVLRSEIDWILVDLDRKGGRALVRARFEKRFTALIGRDPHTKRAFFLVVPPETKRVAQALAWAWNLPKRFWKRGEIEEI